MRFDMVIKNGDVHGKTRRATHYIKNTFTILKGRPMEPIDHPAPPPWIELV